jgi:hypothetical protein
VNWFTLAQIRFTSGKISIRQWVRGFYERRGIFGPNKRLSAYEEGFCSMKFCLLNRHALTWPDIYYRFLLLYSSHHITRKQDSQCNKEAHSHSPCCSATGQSTGYMCVCVCVCLSVCLSVCLYPCLGYPACKSYPFCVVLYCHLWCVWLYHSTPHHTYHSTPHHKYHSTLYCTFPHYLINSTIFGRKNLLSTKSVCIFSTHYSEDFLLLRRIQQDINIHLHRHPRKHPFFLCHY